MKLRTYRPRAGGQASVLGLLFLFACVAAFALMANSVQLTHAHSKLQDTADAAAYSAAVLQSRDFNYAAYTNRAMVANQAAVAQVASLKTWINELEQTYAPHGRLDDLAAKAVLGDEQWASPKAAGYRLARRAKAIVDRSASDWATKLDAITVALSDAQRIYHDASMSAVPGVAEQIARSNDAASRVDAGWFNAPGGGQLAEWRNFVQTRDPQTGDGRLAEVATHADTLDPFVTQRGREWGGGSRRIGIAASPTKTSFCTDGVVVIYVNHAGGTVLVAEPGKWATRWDSLDAADAVATYFCRRPLQLTQTGHLPVGQAGVSTAATDRYTHGCGYGGHCNYGGLQSGTLVPNAAAALLHGPANPDVLDRGVRADGRSTSGLQPYTDLSGRPAPTVGSAFNAAPVITVAVDRALGSVRTLEVLDRHDRRATRMRAVASGRAQFVRPSAGPSPGALRMTAGWDRADGRWEYPSLFNPYWQPFLADTPEARRDAALAETGGGVS
jgi:hypothetical protein